MERDEDNDEERDAFIQAVERMVLEYQSRTSTCGTTTGTCSRKLIRTILFLKLAFTVCLTSVV